jgi:hypothetical protein
MRSPLVSGSSFDRSFKNRGATAPVLLGDQVAFAAR